MMKMFPYIRLAYFRHRVVGKEVSPTSSQKSGWRLLQFFPRQGAGPQHIHLSAVICGDLFSQPNRQHLSLSY